MANQETNAIIAPLTQRLHLAWRSHGSGLFTLAYCDLSGQTDYHVASVVLCQRTPNELAQPVYVGLDVGDSLGDVGIDLYVKGPAEDIERWRRSLPAIGGEWRAFFQPNNAQAYAMMPLLAHLPPNSAQGYTEHIDAIGDAVRTLCDYVSGCIRVDYRLFSPIVTTDNQQPLNISHTDYHNAELNGIRPMQ